MREAYAECQWTSLVLVIKLLLVSKAIISHGELGQGLNGMLRRRNIDSLQVVSNPLVKYKASIPAVIIFSSTLTQSLFRAFSIASHSSSERALSQVKAFALVMAPLLRLLTLATIAVAQNYVGTPINNSLPFVPGSEITYFNVITSSGLNTTLTNYMSFNSSGKRPDPTKIERAVIIVHGLQRDPGTYMSNVLSAISQVPGKAASVDNVALMAPYFPNGDDKNFGYPWTDGLAPGKGSTTNALVWQGSQWAGGANNQYPSYTTHTSSYDALDQIIKWFDNTTVL